MSMIRRINSAMHCDPKSLRIGKSELIALRKYANNADRKPRAEIDHFLGELMKKGPWPLTDEFQQSSKAWFTKLCWTSWGYWRDTAETRKLTPADRYVIETLGYFEFCDMQDLSETGNAVHEYRSHRGHEYLDFLPVFRAVGEDPTDHFMFMNLPWQRGKGSGLRVVLHNSNKIAPEEFVQAYLVCALWSTSGEDKKGKEIEALDSVYGLCDFAPQSLWQANRECTEFVRANAKDLREATSHVGYDWEQAGHDFWLTRNHHGAGFWDRDLGEVGDRLSDAAGKARERYLGVGGDGKLYF